MQVLSEKGSRRPTIGSRLDIAQRNGMYALYFDDLRDASGMCLSRRTAWICHDWKRGRPSDLEMDALAEKTVDNVLPAIKRRPVVATEGELFSGTVSQSLNKHRG